MKTTCAICHITLESLILPQANGIVDLVQKTMQHAVAAHPDVAQGIQGDIARLLDGVGFYLLVTTLLNVPPEETVLLDKLDEFEAELLSLLDYEAYQEEGQETPLLRKVDKNERGGREGTAKDNRIIH